MKLFHAVSVLMLFLAQELNGIAGDAGVETQEQSTAITLSLGEVDFRCAGVRSHKHAKSFFLELHLVFEPKTSLGFRCSRVDGLGIRDEAEVHTAHLYRVLQSGELHKVDMPQISVRSDDSIEVSSPNLFTRPIRTLLMPVSMPDLIGELSLERTATFVVGLAIYRFGEKAEKIHEVRSRPFIIQVEGNRVRISQVDPKGHDAGR